MGYSYDRRAGEETIVEKLSKTERRVLRDAYQSADGAASTTKTTAKKLEKLGLVQIMPYTDDKEAWSEKGPSLSIVLLTKKGESAAEEAFRLIGVTPRRR